MILIDAGPLVALINAEDRHHAACREVLEGLEEPIGTVWPAFTEAIYLLRGSWPAQRALIAMIERGAVEMLGLDHMDIPRIRA